jgi:hypothetical protein
MNHFLRIVAGLWKPLAFFLFFSAYGAAHAGYYDPSAYSGKVIRINTYAQELTYYESGKKIGGFTVSTGDETHETPNGRYKILTKEPRMYSKSAYKYMPYWMEFYDGSYGIHAFPENYRGEKNTSSIIGVKAAGGCVRLRKDQAKKLYDWTELGTTVIIASDYKEFESKDDERVIREYYANLNGGKYEEALSLRIDEKYQSGELEKYNRGFTFEILEMRRKDGDIVVKFHIVDRK